MLKKGLLLFTFLFFSCQRQDYNQTSCNELSMKCFKGFPRACNEVKTQCKEIKIKYTHALCQKALGQLILGKGLKTIKDIHGNEIVGCFTKNDMEKFGK